MERIREIPNANRGGAGVSLTLLADKLNEIINAVNELRQRVSSLEDAKRSQ
jgi:hypothetical protein